MAVLAMRALSLPLAIGMASERKARLVNAPGRVCKFGKRGAGLGPLDDSVSFNANSLCQVFGYVDDALDSYAARNAHVAHLLFLSRPTAV